jgi:hypothetical protein
MVDGIDCVEWKDLIFKLAKSSDLRNIMDHLREEYYPSEPLNQAFGFPEDTGKRLAYLELRVEIYLKQNLSFLALDKSSGMVWNILFLECLECSLSVN